MRAPLAVCLGSCDVIHGAWLCDRTCMKEEEFRSKKGKQGGGRDGGGQGAGYFLFPSQPRPSTSHPLPPTVGARTVRNDATGQDSVGRGEEVSE